MTFLDRIGLGVYSHIFASYGFTTVESLYDAGPEDLHRMRVKPEHQRDLKVALGDFRSVGKDAFTQPASAFFHQAHGSCAPPHGPPPEAQGAYALQPAVTPPSQAGCPWMDPGDAAQAHAAARPCQWVDGPGALPAPSQAPPQQPGGVPMYPYGQPPSGQWVDSPSAQTTPHQTVQDVVFHWVDSPAQGRMPQHYMKPHAMPLYYQGLEPPSPYVATRFGDPSLDPRAAQVAHGVQAPPREPSDLQMEDVAAHRERMPYGTQGVRGSNTYHLFGPPQHSGGGGGKGGKGPAVQNGKANGGRGSNRMQASEDSGARGRGRQAAAGGRQGPETRLVTHGSNGGGVDVRQAAALSADVHAVTELELSPDSLRMTLVSSLESLYQDRIKPMANYVKGRLKERDCPESLVKRFVELYKEHPDLFDVQRPAESDEASIFLRTEPSWFKGWVDIDSSDDPYDEEMWAELAKFLDGEHTFAGGRYGMARELMQRNLPFLAECSLGEVCHIVQLAIQHRRLIVYHRKMLKPIQTVLCQLSPGNNSGPGPEGEDIKDMDDLCFVLFQMLMHNPQGLRLCRLKQMIKHELSRKLSEMSFQCTKLIELFNTEPLAGTFVLDTENDGKSIYVRLGNPDEFTDHVKQIFAMAKSSEPKAAKQ